LATVITFLEDKNCHVQEKFFFVVKGPALDATDIPQCLGLMCNPVMNMIIFFPFFRVTEYGWNEIDMEKPKIQGKTCPSTTLSTTNTTWTESGKKPGLGDDRPATYRLSHDTAL
jgi:hypothetical protein